MTLPVQARPLGEAEPCAQGVVQDAGRAQQDVEPEPVWHRAGQARSGVEVCAPAQVVHAPRVEAARVPWLPVVVVRVQRGEAAHVPHAAAVAGLTTSAVRAHCDARQRHTLTRSRPTPRYCHTSR